MIKQFACNLLLLSCCFTATITFAQQNTPNELPPAAAVPLPPLPQKADLRQWNLQNVDVKNVVEEVARVTGKNFIIDPGVIR